MKDLEQKVANLFMDNVALKTKLEAIREVERQQYQEIAHLKKRLVQALKAQVKALGTFIVCILFDHISLCTTGHGYSRAVTVMDQGVTAGEEG